MPGNPTFGGSTTPRPLGTFFRWEIPSEGISVHLNLRIIELMERDAIQAGTKAVAGVLLGRPHCGREFILNIEHYEMATLDGEVSDSPFVDPKLADSIRDRWRPGRSRMSILGLYRTTGGDATLNSDDTGALAKILETDDQGTRKAGGEYAPRVTPIVEDPNQVFLMIGPRTERISKATLYLVRKGVVICESPQVPFDRTELSKLGSAGTPREPRPSAIPEPRFSTQDVPSPAEPKREPRKKPETSSQSGLGLDLNIPNWVWPALAVPILGLLIGGFYWNHAKQPTARLPTSADSATATTSVLGLKLDRSGPAWKLSWNENAAVVQGAVKGRLLITDGGVHRTLELEESDLHGGTIIYSPVTNDVVLELQVDSPDSSPPVSETVRVVGGVLPPLASPQSADALSLPSNNPGDLSPPPSPSIPSAVQPTYPTNSTQMARNFPPAETKSAPAPQVYPYTGLRSQPTPAQQPSVAAEMPEPYRSLMMKPNSAPTQPIPASKPAPAATQMPTAYRALLQPTKPVSHPVTNTKSSATTHASRSVSPVPAKSLALRPAPAPRVAPTPSRSLVSPKAHAPSAGHIPALSSKPVEPSGETESAELLSRTDPDYPTTAKQLGLAGNVEVHFRIGADGQVHDVTVVSGVPMLSQAAVQAVQKWRYKPARIGGVPADSDASAVFTFKQN